jgi:uncharacterized protein (TIGR02391 family)
MARVALFVDGGGMFYAQREQGWHIDFRSVYELFTRGRDVYGAFYFTAAPRAGDKQRLKKYRSFRRALAGIGYRVVDKEVKAVIDRETGQTRLRGSLDLEIAFRMLSTADRWDEAVLLGGDADHAPIVEHLANLGKRVVLVGRRKQTAMQLLEAVHEFVDLETIRQQIEKGPVKDEREETLPVGADGIPDRAALTAPAIEDGSPDLLRLHPAIMQASKKAYLAGDYVSAVSRAFIAVESYVRRKASSTDRAFLRKYGRSMMSEAFSEANPVLKLTALSTQSETDEQEGFRFLFMGMTALRNALFHEETEWEDREKAFRYLQFTSLLLARLDEAGI